MGADIEVPPARMYWPSTTQVTQRLVKRLVGARLETILAPGALTSGFLWPSSVTPRADQEASVSSLWARVPWSSTPPTEITYGSLPGARVTASSAVPRLPAAATTTIPLNQAASTAALSGSVL